MQATFLDKIKYVSQDFRARDADFIGNGVVSLSHFPISFPSTPNMTAIVGSSSLSSTAWCGYGFRVSDQAVPTTLTFATADPTNPRIDIIQIGVNTTTDANNDTTGTPVLQVKQGVAAASPIEPGADPGFVKLWAINIATNQTTITASNVIDRRTLVPLNVDGSQIQNPSGLQTSAFQSFLSDLIGNTSLVYSGGVATKDGTVATQLDVTAADVYFAAGQHVNFPASTNGQFVTSSANATYYLDYNSDATVSWGTTHSTKTGYVPICSVTTDASGHILTITDTRPLNPLIPSANLPKASAGAVGAVKIGSNITVAADGTISIPSYPWSSLTGKPSTIAGYGITDNLVGSLTAGANISVSNPSGLGAATVSLAGIVPIANGGTGSSTQNFVDLTSAQSIGGNKTLTGLLFANGGINVNQTNGGIEIGSTSLANTPFVDFHSSGNNLDYDARIIAIGGSATTGQGRLQLLGGSIQTANNTLDNGSGLITSNGGVEVNAQGTATSATNYWSQVYRLYASKWNGTAAVTNAGYFQMDYNGYLHWYSNASGSNIEGFSVDPNGNFTVFGTPSVMNTKGFDNSFGVYDYNAALGANVTNKNLGGVQWQINGVSKMANIMYANTDGSGNITYNRALWYAYPLTATIFSMDLITGGIFTKNQTIDDGNGLFTTIYSPTLSSTSGTNRDIAKIQGNVTNAMGFVVRQSRTATGSDWTTTALDLLRRTDATDQQYIRMDGSGNISLFPSGGTAQVAGNEIYHNGNVPTYFANSKAANGYQKLPGGLIIQWGSVSIPTNNSGHAAFPISFPTAVASVTKGTYSSTFPAQEVSMDIAPDINGVTFDNNNGFSVTVYWIAIGY